MFSLRLIPIDFIFVHNDPNYIFLSILSTKNMVIHNLQTMNNVYKNFNPTPHLFGHWSPHLYECYCVLFIYIYIFLRLSPINYFAVIFMVYIRYIVYIVDNYNKIHNFYKTSTQLSTHFNMDSHILVVGDAIFFCLTMTPMDYLFVHNESNVFFFYFGYIEHSHS